MSGAKLRVGTVPYLVGRPLDLGLDEEASIEFTRAVPARLARGLRDDSLDVALVSSIELFRLEGASFLEGPCVAGEGFVGSVQAFLRRPIEAVRSVALDPASRTAATLVRVVWPGKASARPAFVEVAEGADPRDAGTDAYLRIGDEALRESLAPGALPVFNPSAAWRELTGLPFVFALWVARAGVALEPHVDLFARARDRGRERAVELAREAARAWRLPEAATARYLLEECLYEPGERMRPALFAFRDRAAALGLARADLEPRGVRVPRVETPSGTRAPLVDQGR